MGKKLGVERGSLEILLHLLGGQDEIIYESTQNHQPPPPDKKLTVPNNKMAVFAWNNTMNIFKGTVQPFE
jgi:hypothetical protein